MKGLLGVLLIPLVASCSTAEADLPVIEQEIEAGVEDQTQQRGVQVDCPEQIDWEAGGEFHCFAEDRSGQTARITVHMENEAGEWSWVVG